MQAYVGTRASSSGKSVPSVRSTGPMLRCLCEYAVTKHGNEPNLPDDAVNTIEAHRVDRRANGLVGDYQPRGD
jgi:hypothetical protein